MKKAVYEKPVLTRHETLKDLTFECPDWQCSVGGIDDLEIPPA